MTGPGYGCAFDACAKPVRWLLTDLANGATISLCADDFPVGMIPMVAAELGVDPARMYDTVKRFVDREAAKAAKATAAAPPPPPPEEEEEEPPADDYDPGQEVDDEGGMSERRSGEHPETVGWS